MPSLELCWRKPVIKSVTALRIVKHLDVVEDVLPGVVPDCIGLALDALTLEKLEEAFSGGIIVTVPTLAHTELQPMLRQEIAPVLAGEVGTRDDLRADVFDYIERFYNPLRRHSTVSYLSPV